MSRIQNLEWLNADDAKNIDDDWHGDEMGFKTFHEEDSKEDIFRSTILTSIQVKSATIKSVSVSRKAIYVVTSDKQVLRWLLDDNDLRKAPKKESMMELIIRGGSPQQRPEQVFCEHAGWHCIVTFNTDIAHYFHITSNQSLLLNKLAQGQSIYSVGWSRSAERNNTRETLLGTSKGMIMELNIEYDPQADVIKHNCIPLFTISQPIFGIEYIIFQGLPSKLSVIVACPNHLYQFIGDPNEQGRPNFTEVFRRYKDHPQRLQRAVHELSGDMKKSQLQLYFSAYRADSFAWMNGLGLFFGKLPSTASEEIYVGQMKPVQYPKGIDTLIGIGMTQYHLYFLCPSSLFVVSKISQQIVHSIEFEKRQGYEMIGMMFDDQTHSFYAWSHKFVYQVSIDNEERDVWRYYVEQFLFDDAIKFCEITGSASLPKVKALYGDYLCANGKKIEAAEAYAQSEKSFEEIALKFMEERDALQKFLETKLAGLGNDMNAQKTLLSTWLVEIYLDNINHNYMSNEELATEAEGKLQQFLEEHKTDLDEETTCDLLQSHGRIDDWVFFADLCKKHEMVMLHHINQQEIRKALAKLSQIEPNGKENLLYKFAPIFMKYEPRKSVEILIELTKQKRGHIDAKKLLPALMNVDQTSREEAIKFEHFLIKEIKFKDRSLHNLYLFHLSETTREKEIIDYLKTQENFSELGFDSEYALSVFKQNGKIESQIFLYSLLKMHSEAVTLALENKKLELAKINAQKPEKFDEELSRKLWLQIAIFHIKNGNVRDALNVMNESKLVKMEDLLPYFDEHDSISNFKDDICRALDGYKDKISELNNELKESKASAQQVKAELKSIKERYIEIEGVQACEVCNKPVMKRSFYVYPCSHAYHRDCLLDMMMPILKQKDYIKATRIQRILDDINEKEGGVSQKKAKKPEESKESLKDLYIKLDLLLAPQCYYCSPQFIETIRDDLIENNSEEDHWSIDNRT
ncbi:hypothetical protein SteCoe_29243 [Stentor coeruleus]|uniref:Uncharacterized protein n=1 Tax=Stentor coeruleus TaxID=5963 RepID=A0A1R2B6W3_9CILI|nr:hypothetical protein SteCoe_29243 [Stentor coeruleus]